VVAAVVESSLARRLRVVIVLGAISAMGPLAIDLYLPGLPSLSDDLHASASAAQLTLTACLAGLAFGQLVSGPLSDRFGRRGPLIVGLAIFAATSFACALAPNIEVLVLLRFVQGFAGAAGIVIGRAVVRDLRSGAAAARLFSLLMLVTGLAPTLAPILGGQLLRITDWRGLFVALGAVGVVLVLGCFALPETLAHDRRHAGGWREIARTFQMLARAPVFRGYAIVLSFVFAAMFAYIAGSPFVLQDIHGMSAQLYSVVFAVNALGLVIVSQANGLLVERVGPRRLLATGVGAGALAGLALLAVVLVDGIGLGGILPCLFVVTACLGFVMPNATALALPYNPPAAGCASGLLGVLMLVVGAAGAPLVGVAGDRSAVPMGVMIAVLGVAASVALALTARSAAHRA
jgi:DHA1 family bicyclomycin/chloramphenicol resistance-like MFS transporter